MTSVFVKRKRKAEKVESGKLGHAYTKIGMESALEKNRERGRKRDRERETRRQKERQKLGHASTKKEKESA